MCSIFEINHICTADVLLSSYLYWKIYYDDHSLLSSTPAVQT